ncbi:Hob1p [Coprinopsis cinerea okayama7|uniref:Hob1p n=1 Tax=Coprinopsis cinerea (strain Okayama-7 / 130 / ATCC MYA-4618 / FGSC 9003) TaxID=240176 RepID=A8N234_COPC7|nr:Hob1p [Coprinopsis cinerea okayama7\|eukprot:XP_001828933.1 Hob1p [Coprinopsis cinerea okayama7\
MKGIGKALARTPFAVTSRIGMAKKSSDPEFDDWHKQFQAIEQGTEKLLKDTNAFVDAVTSLFTSSSGFATHFAVIFQPIQGEFDLLGKHPDATHTIRNVTQYQNAMEEMQQLISPELELITTRIHAPLKEFQAIVKTIRKTITKRDHKLTDYDRFNNSLTKLRDKKEKSLSDEKNLFKLEQDFEIATNEYEYINTALKQDLPRFMQLATAFIDPLFNSFFYMQLNIYYLLLEKMQSFADNCKYDITNVPGAEIQYTYESKRTDAWERIESLNIVKRIISVSRLVQAQRAQGGGAGISRANTVASSSSSYSSRPAPPPSRTGSSAAAYKKPPPPPPGSSSQYAAPPPPYTPASASASSSAGHLQMPTPSLARSPSAASSVAATKRPPPPPPPLKPKPKPVVVYVTALYDFDAQAEGDLSFRAGDRIELVKKTESQEDWWTGRLNGQEGIFPGNYVQEQ